MNDPPAWMIGPHTLRWEEPHTLWVTLVGNNTLEEARQMVGVYQTLSEHGPYFILADMSAAKVLESEARHHLSEHLEAHWFQGIIFYNTRLLHRAMARGLLLAAELFRAAPEASVMRGRVHFVSTRDQARALVDRLEAQELGTQP